MPRKLLRVALVAAIIPALAPESSSAQTVKPASAVQTTAPTQASKKGVAGWLQKLRGEKPAPATGKIIKVSDQNPFEESAAASDSPFDLEGNSDVRLLKSNQPTRRRPTAKVMEFAPSTARSTQEQVPTSTGSRVDPSRRPLSQAPQARTPAAVATPVAEAVATPVNDIDNPFPDDAPTQRRGRQAAAANVADFAGPSQRATSAEESAFEEEMDALPIESAAPPTDVNADFRSAEGTTPRYRRTNMQGPVTNSIEVPPAPDEEFSPVQPVQPMNPAPTHPMGQIATRANGGPAVIHTPHSNLPIYGQGPIGAPVMHGGPAGYARLDAALYPSPRQDIPAYVGSTMITNPAFDPHEMLYAHRYRGLYGPFYHKTHRSWVMTPFGICKNEKRVLVGTEVRVNYKSSISPFSLFFPPVIK